MSGVVVLTACTSRKTQAVPDALRMRGIPRGSLDEVGRAWARAVNDAAPVCAAQALYAGRDYRRLAGPNRLHVVSAGLGLLAPDTPVPSYDATVAAGVEDSVFARILGKASPRAWFATLQARSRYALPVHALSGDGLILAALPSRYLAMIADDLVRLGPDRLRLFTGARRDVPDALQNSLMPYDGLLADVPGYNGPLVGFAERALSHFLAEIHPLQPDGDRLGHQRAVRDALRRPAERS